MTVVCLLVLIFFHSFFYVCKIRFYWQNKKLDLLLSNFIRSSEILIIPMPFHVNFRNITNIYFLLLNSLMWISFYPHSIEWAILQGKLLFNFTWKFLIHSCYTKEISKLLEKFQFRKFWEIIRVIGKLFKTLKNQSEIQNKIGIIAVFVEPFTSCKSTWKSISSKIFMVGGRSSSYYIK